VHTSLAEKQKHSGAARYRDPEGSFLRGCNLCTFTASRDAMVTSGKIEENASTTKELDCDISSGRLGTQRW
jgi:hypothetical protein